MSIKRSILSLISRVRVAYRSVYPTMEEQSFVGRDLEGNTYHEYPLWPGGTRKRKERQVHFSKPGRIDTKFMSVEWSSWLQYRRKIPPTIEELLKNKHIAEMKKINAEKLAIKEGRSPPPENKPHNFPIYAEYLKSPTAYFTDYDYMHPPEVSAPNPADAQQPPQQIRAGESSSSVPSKSNDSPDKS